MLIRVDQRAQRLEVGAVAADDQARLVVLDPVAGHHDGGAAEVAPAQVAEDANVELRQLVEVQPVPQLFRVPAINDRNMPDAEDGEVLERLPHARHRPAGKLIAGFESEASREHDCMRDHRAKPRCNNQTRVILTCWAGNERGRAPRPLGFHHFVAGL